MAETVCQDSINPFVRLILSGPRPNESLVSIGLPLIFPLFVQDEHKSRKSVSFSADNTMVDTDGTSEQVNGGGEGGTADHHSTGDKSVDEMTTMFEGLKKRKPKKKTSTDEAAEDSPAGDADFDPSALKLKKKKKKSKPSEAPADDFEAKLAEAGVTEKEEADAKEAKAVVQEGDMEKGTGVFAHNETEPIKYDLLLDRFYTLLHSQHPDLASSGTKSYKIPPPQCLREGNKKTIFANISEIGKRMKRSDEHIIQFLFAELGTSGSVDGSKRLVIKGRFQQKQIENVLRRYISKLTALLY
jgi:translation initiation factor 2 subunit 2